MAASNKLKKVVYSLHEKEKEPSPLNGLIKNFPPARIIQNQNPASRRIFGSRRKQSEKQLKREKSNRSSLDRAIAISNVHPIFKKSISLNQEDNTEHKRNEGQSTLEKEDISPSDLMVRN